MFAVRRLLQSPISLPTDAACDPLAAAMVMPYLLPSEPFPQSCRIVPLPLRSTYARLNGAIEFVFLASVGRPSLTGRTGKQLQPRLRRAQRFDELEEFFRLAAMFA